MPCAPLRATPSLPSFRMFCACIHTLSMSCSVGGGGGWGGTAEGQQMVKCEGELIIKRGVS
jgi:hypothetical protein